MPSFHQWETKLNKNTVKLTNRSCQLNLLNTCVDNESLDVLSSVQPRIGKSFHYPDLELQMKDILSKTRKSSIDLGIMEASRDISKLRGIENQMLTQAADTLSDQQMLQLRRSIDRTQSHIRSKLSYKHSNKLTHHGKVPSSPQHPTIIKRAERSKGQQAYKQRSRKAYKQRRQSAKKERLSERLRTIDESNMVLNFSDIPLPTEAKLYLAKGTGFVTPRKPDRDRLNYDVREFVRNIAWRAHHNKNREECDDYHTNQQEDFPRSLYIKRTGWSQNLEPGIEELKTELKQFVDQLELSTPPSNLTTVEIRGQNWCRSMVRLGKLIFTKADKGGSVLVMNPRDVDTAISSELSKSDSYNKLATDPNDQILQQQRSMIEGLISGGSYNSKILETITGYTERGGKLRKTCFKTTTGIPYPLFKIHKLEAEQIRDKKIPPSRLVHALTQSPTTRLEKYIAHHFGQVSRNYSNDEYIKDTSDFLRQIKDLVLDERDLLFTMDVKALYPSMRQDIVRQSVNAALEEDTTLAPNIKSGMMTSINFCLQNSTLEYRGEFFRAIKGVPTGGSISRPLADTFLKFLKIFLKENIDNWDLLVKLWKRYIDDIFGIWSGTEEEFYDFVKLLNSKAAAYGIEFTEEIGRELSFLDVLVKIRQSENGTFVIATSLYQKPTDNRSFLQRNSYHPPHVFKSVPYSQLLRARTICSDEKAFDKAAKDIISDLKKSGYDEQELKIVLEKVNLVDRNERLKPKKTDVEKKEETSTNLILSAQYCKELKDLRMFLESKKQTIEHIIGENVSITIANRRGSNISDQLFKRRKFATTPAEYVEQSRRDNNTSSQACKRPRCLTCKLTENNTDGKFNVNNQICELDMSLNCSDENVIYVAQCKLCSSGFYFGQTWLPLNIRMNNHRAAFKPEHYNKSSLALHIHDVHYEMLDDKLSSFNLGIIRKCNRDDLNMYEDMFIERFKARIIGLNRSKVSGN